MNITAVNASLPLMLSFTTQTIGDGGASLRNLTALSAAIRDGIGRAVKSALQYSDTRSAITLLYPGAATLSQDLTRGVFRADAAQLCDVERLMHTVSAAMVRVQQAVDRDIAAQRGQMITLFDDEELLHSRTLYLTDSTYMDWIEKSRFTLFVLMELWGGAYSVSER